MEINRHQYFLAGLVLLFVGVQFRLTESFTLTGNVTRYLAEYSEHPELATAEAVEAVVGIPTTIPPKTVKPPEWIGWCLISVGSVLVLHSFAMPRPI